MRTLILCLLAAAAPPVFAEDPELSISWKDNILKITGEHIPGGELEVWYLEAFCRPGSTEREWDKTVIPHITRLLESKNGVITLESEIEDGVVVTHTIKAESDAVSFNLMAHNPTDKTSEAHWAQPCIRVGKFTGTHEDEDKYAYLPKSFIFVDGKQKFLPVHPWKKEALYTPGQVWRHKDVDADDLNPRPLSSIIPSNGLIGCVSADKRWLMATAWEPWQELFQGVIRCLHSDFRIGGLKPGEKKSIRGRIYILPNDVKALLARYKKDFE